MTDEHHSQSHLVDAYNRMLERTRKAMDELREETAPALKHVLETARNKAVELGELSRDEAEKISAWVERDLHDAARYMDENRSELAAWFRFDIDQIEERIASLFADMVDHTREELDRLARTAELVGWHTGEVVGPGTLSCRNCGTHLHFHQTGHVPPCPRCAGTHFSRVHEED